MIVVGGKKCMCVCVCLIRCFDCCLFSAINVILENVYAKLQIHEESDCFHYYSCPNGNVVSERMF